MKLYTDIISLNEIKKGDWVAFRYNSEDNWTIASWEDSQINHKEKIASVKLSGIWHEWDSIVGFEAYVLADNYFLGYGTGPTTAITIHLFKPAS